MATLSSHIPTKEAVIDAYNLVVQGFFVKPNSYEQMENTIRKIMAYWKECIAPSEFDN